jgi:hypothetical protein
MTVTALDRTEPAERYFVEVARSVFDDYFEELGARHPQFSKRNVVRYDSDSWFAEVIYLPEDGPNYSPRVLIGCREEQYEDPRRNRADVMHTVPEGCEERSYNLLWKYRNRHQLEATLKSVRDQIIEIYAKPYFADSERLRSLLEERYEAIETEWADEIDTHNATVFRKKAEKAFRSKDYANAIRFYEQIPASRLTDTDRSKVKYARSHAG